ncbi:hypothetical protein [Mesorhizobium sp.]|uniref:hypothetical protein n=1 Tax=Mesorhizobium sp. TaxID=1871066 RepID=UPI0025F38C2F|nr:hypothetical protein [Mesorhizobium sp.]
MDLEVALLEPLPDGFRGREQPLSLVSIIESHGIKICFPGDMEVAGWDRLLARESYFFAISDSGREYASQDMVSWYRHRCRGVELNGERWRVLSTRKDGRVRIQTSPQGVMVDVF